MTRSTPRRILVTGATGKLGTVICRHLVDQGHDVRATDKRFAPDFPAPIELGDLLDEHFVYRVLDGRDTVVHLGNHAHPNAGPSKQRLLGENVQMNANVFDAAVDVGIDCIVFASSIQAILRLAGGGHEPPYPVPYLPLDSEVPTDPADNPYALSKEFGERMLRLHCANRATLSATVLRFPMLPSGWWASRLSDPTGLPRRALNFGECLAHLLPEDAAELTTRVVERRLVGYHQYFPAVSMKLRNLSPETLIDERYAGVPLKCPAHELDSLIDLSQLRRDLDWEPKRRLEVTLQSDA